MENNRLLVEIWANIRSFDHLWTGVYARIVTDKRIRHILEKETDSTDAGSIQWKITKQFSVLRQPFFGM